MGTQTPFSPNQSDFVPLSVDLIRIPSTGSNGDDSRVPRNGALT